MLNILLFWHDHHGISTKKPIQLRQKLLKTHKYQIDDFAKECSTSIIVRILEEIKKNLYTTMTLGSKIC